MLPCFGSCIIRPTKNTRPEVLSRKIDRQRKPINTKTDNVQVRSGSMRR